MWSRRPGLRQRGEVYNDLVQLRWVSNQNEHHSPSLPFLCEILLQSAKFSMETPPLSHTLLFIRCKKRCQKMKNFRSGKQAFRNFITICKASEGPPS